VAIDLPEINSDSIWTEVAMNVHGGSCLLAFAVLIVLAAIGLAAAVF